MVKVAQGTSGRSSLTSSAANRLSLGPSPIKNRINKNFLKRFQQPGFVVIIILITEGIPKYQVFKASSD
jgi:hypothetical protein